MFHLVSPFCQKCLFQKSPTMHDGRIYFFPFDVRFGMTIQKPIMHQFMDDWYYNFGQPYASKPEKQNLIVFLTTVAHILILKWQISNWCSCPQYNIMPATLWCRHNCRNQGELQKATPPLCPFTDGRVSQCNWTVKANNFVGCCMLVNIYPKVFCKVWVFRCTSSTSWWTRI